MGYSFTLRAGSVKTGSVVAKGASVEREEEFKSVIRETLQGIVDKGFEEKALLSAINYYEFQYREADFGRRPKGLMYGIQMMDSWLYDDSKPFAHFEANPVTFLPFSPPAFSLMPPPALWPYPLWESG